ncbi:MAG: relaxase/mobilization nuclease domain-containing protein [Methanobrevibacter sp.]|uniref:relaxase/mobilization nuclease domain-containing protein n=1 Tax=Methanobrevibacter sp. TaxID=66852 RepID=UPI0025E65D45|nr:relaxase/mobilization nuclease domain-containing protein [Methanobrevibacter sp.]MBQ6100502.1 relaxase/mobilization nuclease domain-containing protein [Methanobrevibacter sp.]
MAITKIWSLHSSLKAAVQYIENTEKTTEVDIKSRIASNDEFISPSFRDNTDIQIANLKQAIGYISQEYKTEEKRLVSGINCTAENALAEMNKEKEYFGKTGGVVGYHCVQSFMPGEIDPDHAHLIGLELAQKVWGDYNYQVVVATHIDREHIHNHFIINSVSLDGEKHPCCYHRKISYISDEIIKQHGLSVITDRGISPAVLPHYSKRQLKAKMDIDEGIAVCNNLSEFRDFMRNRGYELDLSDNHKFWTLQHSDWQRPMRFIRFGDDYSNERLVKRIENEYMVMPDGYTRDSMSPSQLYMYENRYARIQKNWKNTYQYQFFMFMLKTFGINLNDYQVHPERYSRQQKKDLEQVWKSLQSITLLNELGVKTTTDAEKTLTGLQQKIAFLEKEQTKLRHQIYILSRSQKDPEAESAARAQLKSINIELKDLRTKRKMLEGVMKASVSEPEKGPEPGIEPE